MVRHLPVRITPTQNRLLHDDLWSTITNLAMQSKQSDVAVGYLGSGANKLLPLQKGDSLVVDMSQDVVKKGQTNPFEIEKYYNKGVNVYTYSNLHAKLYVFDSRLVVCSANVSQHSKDVLTEVGLLSDDKDLLETARELVKSFQFETVTPEYINLCKRIYNPPIIKHGIRGKAPPNQSNLWLVSVWPLEIKNKKEEELDEIEEKKALEKIKNSREYQTRMMRWNANSNLAKNVYPGDLIVKVDNDEKEKEVYPPSRVIHLKKYQSFDKNRHPRIFIYTE